MSTYSITVNDTVRGRGVSYFNIRGKVLEINNINNKKVFIVDFDGKGKCTVSSHQIEKEFDTGLTNIPDLTNIKRKSNSNFNNENEEFLDLDLINTHKRKKEKPDDEMY